MENYRKGRRLLFAELCSSIKQYTPHIRYWEWYIRMNVSDASDGGRHKSVIMYDHLFKKSEKRVKINGAWFA